MIRFADKLDKTESAEFPEQSKFKEIKPILKTSDDKVQDYWNDVFSDDKSSDDIGFTDEEIISDIFDRSESDFRFDFDFKNKAIQEKLAEFNSEKWDRYARAVTEDQDPNGNLHKAGGYTSTIYFESKTVNQSDVYVSGKYSDSGYE